LKPLLDPALGALAVALLRAVHWMDRRRSANFAGAFMRKVGPLLKEHRLGRDNLRAAFPEKSDAEIEKILGGVWDNLGRLAIEFAHLDDFSIAGFETPTRDIITYAPETAERFERIRTSGQAMIGFGAHLANWEIPGVGATKLGVKSALLYRRPGIPAISDLIVKLRTPLMGEMIPTTLDAPVRLARLLQSGVSVGMLADQHYTRGVPVTFFGRPCLANPLVALLARQTGAPIRGLRVVRNPDGNSFWGEITDEIKPARDVEGNFDVAGTMQAVMAVIESWVREFPEQWLWLHRRWR
jgi:Kdo2-lipid IVA lauroyltransferase/acyltransferase